MACFLAPTTAAIVATAVRKKFLPQYHFEKLLLMLWGAAIVLIVDHLISGELVPSWPFLTASSSQIISEIWKIGVPMLAAILVIWTFVFLIPTLIARRQTREARTQHKSLLPWGC